MRKHLQELGDKIYITSQLASIASALAFTVSEPDTKPITFCEGFDLLAKLLRENVDQMFQAFYDVEGCVLCMENEEGYVLCMEKEPEPI